MNDKIYRRGFLKSTGAAALAFPMLSSWAGLNWIAPENNLNVPKRLIIMFSPNGMVTDGYWPKTEGPDFEMDTILKPLQPFREKTLLVHGVCNKIRGDGDGHMRGMSCLLTGKSVDAPIQHNRLIFRSYDPGVFIVALRYSEASPPGEKVTELLFQRCETLCDGVYVVAFLIQKRVSCVNPASLRSKGCHGQFILLSDREQGEQGPSSLDRPIP